MPLLFQRGNRIILKARQHLCARAVNHGYRTSLTSLSTKPPTKQGEESDFSERMNTMNYWLSTFKNSKPSHKTCLRNHYREPTSNQN